METEGDITATLQVAYLVMTGVVTAFLFFFLYSRKRYYTAEREKQLAIFKAAVDAEEKHRQRLAENLHDEVIPLFTAIIQNSDLATRGVAVSGLDNSFVENSKKISLMGIQAIRDISQELVPKVLREVGLYSALQTYVRLLPFFDLIVLDENSEKVERGQLFTEQSRVNIYRLCTEVIANLSKHDKFTYLEITLLLKHNFLEIRFLHDGRGVSDEEILNYENLSNGLGLKSIRSRLLILKGTISYQKGVGILARFPIELT